jgi:hypothetical protein
VPREAMTKGFAFDNVRVFARTRFGPEGWGATLAHMVPEDREVLGAVVSVGWYPLPLYARLIRALDEAYGTGDCAIIIQSARFAAERNLGTVFRTLLRFTSPAYMLEKFGQYWPRVHDTGRWELVREGDGAASATLYDLGYVDQAICRDLGGYFARTLELVGAKGVILDHVRCRARGADACEFRARWSASASRV